MTQNDLLMISNFLMTFLMYSSADDQKLAAGKYLANPGEFDDSFFIRGFL